MKRALLVIAAILSGAFFIATNEVEAATVYDDSDTTMLLDIGKIQPIAQRYYVYYNQVLAHGNPPTTTSVIMPQYDTIALKFAENNVPLESICYELTQNTFAPVFIYTSSTTQATVSSIEAYNGACEIHLSSPKTTLNHISIVYENYSTTSPNFSRYIYMNNDSTQTSGYAYNGLNTAYINTYPSFKLCNTHCDSGGWGEFDTSTTTRMYNFEPETPYTTQSQTNLFEFDYYIGTDYALYDDVCLYIEYANSFSGGTGASIQPRCQEINASGQSHFAAEFTLPDNTSYYWWAQINGVNATNTLTSNIRYLIVGTDPNLYQSPYGPQADASSTLNAIGSDILGYYKFIWSTKFPFNWVEGGINAIMVVSDIDTSTSSMYEFDGITLDVEQFGTSTLTAAGVTTTPMQNIDMFSTTTLFNVAQIDGIQTARTVGSWILYILLTMMAITEVASIFAVNKHNTA